MNQFIYCLTNPGNESYLKAEMRLKFPADFALSFSRPGLCTFKNKREPLNLKKMQNISFTFARAWGIAIGLVKAAQVLETVEKEMAPGLPGIYCTQIPMDPAQEELLTFKQALNALSTSGCHEAQGFLIVVQVASDLFMVGRQLKDEWQSPPGRIFYELTATTTAPSRAYHKIKETALLLGSSYNLQGPKTSIEFGCAPGGSTQFLLEQGLHVTGVDPAKMDADILKHPNFNFIQAPMQGVTLGQLPAPADLLLGDINLAPKTVLRNFRNLFANSAPPMALITLKLAAPELIDEMHTWSKIFSELGYHHVKYVQLLSHRKECLAIAVK